MIPASVTASALGAGHQLSASFVNSFRVAAVADRLAAHIKVPPGGQSHNSEFFSLCLSLARGIDYALSNNEIPAKAQDLPLLLKLICKRRNDSFLQAAIMVLMISVKNACTMSWFSDNESQELLTLATEVCSCFCSPGDIINNLNDSSATVLAVMTRFYPLMKMGQVLTSVEAEPGYRAIVVDFHISKNTAHSPHEKIRLFIAQKDNIETSACIISPQEVNILLNGKGVDRRITTFMDTGPRMPTNVTTMLKYGTNLLQAVGRFSGHYIIVVAFMSMELSSLDASVLPDYIQSCDVGPNSEDSDIIEGPSRISLKCPISRTRIRTPVKGQACKHLQCFDFGNYVDINCRRPSWRCPHCNQHICYPDLRVDQNMVKVLKEVGQDVSDVIISADGSWKAVLEDDDNADQLNDKMIFGQNDRPEQSESAKDVPIFLDLTQGDNEVEAMEIIEIEESKPLEANLQSLSSAPNLSSPRDLGNTAGINQNIASDMENDFWSVLYTNNGHGSFIRTDALVDGLSESSPLNFTLPTIFSDAISPAPNQAEAHGTANLSVQGIQNQFSTASNMQLQLINSVSSHEYGRSPFIGRQINRTPIAVQALPAVAQTPTPQQGSLNSMNTLSTNGSPLPQASLPSAPSLNGFIAASSDMERQSQFSRSPASSHQSWNQPERPFVPAQSVQQVAGVAALSQLPGSYRASSGHLGEHHNLQSQQALNMRTTQLRGPSPGLIRSPSPLLRTPPQQGAGLGHPAGNVNNNPSRFGAAATPRAVQMPRQPPMVAVQTQTPRASSFSSNVGGVRASPGNQRVNVGGLAASASRPEISPGLESEQNWRPAGRMRGSLTGRAYSAGLSQLMIQPTHLSQGARPQAQTNLTSSSTTPPHLQALLASRNATIPQMQNVTMTETGGVNASPNTLPARSSGMQ